MSNLKGPYDISEEEWREYEFNFVLDKEVRTRTYQIFNPKNLWVGDTTHRIEDSDGKIHCVPTVGEKGCILRWKSKDKENPVSF